MKKLNSIADLKAAVKEFKPVLDLRENHTDAIPDKRDILVCGGTGCTSSDSLQIIENLKAEIENNNKHTIQHYTNDIFVCNENLYKYTEDEILKNIIEFLNNNYNKKICMSDLEEISHISRQAIHQKFKKHLGKTPIQFLQEVRMRESKTFLLNTNLLIYEIADKCGFEDAYYFSNSFKKWVGISPRSYRNKFKI